MKSRPSESSEMPSDHPSIFDGWEGQTKGKLHNSKVGTDCALGWLAKHPAEQARVNRLTKWIQCYYDNPGLGIPSVNDGKVYGWTPEDFREADRRAEWDFVMCQVSAQIDAIFEPHPEDIRQ